MHLTDQGSTKAEKQSMAISGLHRLEKKEAGTRAGQEDSRPSHRGSSGIHKLCLLVVLPKAVINMQPYFASATSLEFILHVFLGALDSVTIVNALILGKEERKKKRMKETKN